MRSIYGILTLFLVTSLHAQMSLDFGKAKSVDLNRFQDEAISLLPPKIKNDLGKINIKFVDLPNGALGRASILQPDTIELDFLTLDFIHDEFDTPTDRTHQSAYREVMATLLHEIVHLYDYKTKLSNNSHLLYLSGRQRNPLAENSEIGFKHRSPDSHEGTNDKEFLAVNMEYFLLDPNYACRRPLLYEFFRDHFNFIPYTVACQIGNSYLAINPENGEVSLKKIDFNRLYQVHYFLAGKGEEMMSRWGHAMIRFVICAPHRKLGPDCMKDLSHHLILSYRAMITNGQINSLDGLTGKYPSRLFFLKISDVIDEYNKGELRDLYSYPLNIDREETKRIYLRALEAHWTYDGKYYFFANNCATESANLIRAGIKNEKLLKERIYTPTGLRDTLLELGLTDKTNLQNRKKAITEGYIFDSYRDRYKLAFEKIKPHLREKADQFETYFKLPASLRETLIEISFPDLNRTETASLLLLESGIFRIKRMELFEQVGKIILDENAKDEAKEKIKNAMKEMNELSNLTASPWNSSKKNQGYAIPLEGEITIEAVKKDEATTPEKKQAELSANIEQLIGVSTISEIQDTGGNLILLKEILREKKE